jgi:tetratricopeptide (TPR) repeat protein
MTSRDFDSTPPGNEIHAGAALFEKGRQAENAGHLDEARRAYELALDQDCGRHDWLYRLGCVLLKLDLPGDAELALRRAVELQPDTPAYLTNLGVCCDRQGRRDEAVLWYRRSTQKGSGSAVAYHNLGAIYAEAGRAQEAIRAFESAIAIEPDAEGYHNLGLVHYGDAEYTRALECFERALACDAGFMLGQYYAALCLMKCGMYADACRRFEEAWRLDPRLVRVPFYLGTCLHKLQRYEEARLALEHAIEYTPEDGRLHYQLALTCDALGMPQEARLHYSQARAAREQRGSA